MNPATSMMPARFSRLNRDLRPMATERHHEHIAHNWSGLLAALYSDPARHYHHLGHIENLLQRLDALDLPFTSHGLVPAVQVAIWFHDAIYMPIGSPGANERCSSNLALSFLTSIGFHIYPAGVDFMTKVEKAILATTHDSSRPPEDEVARLMLDLDLAGFADDWETFDENNRAIRKEFAGASDQAYRWGRLKFLTGLMARPVIYHRLVDLEEPARRNIERHIGDLLADRL